MSQFIVSFELLIVSAILWGVVLILRHKLRAQLKLTVGQVYRDGRGEHITIKYQITQAGIPIYIAHNAKRYFSDGKQVGVNVVKSVTQLICPVRVS